jgi:DNA-binding transcriptional ArsR family regulator
MIDGLRALANDNRFQILEWLKDSEAHFPLQADGDLVSEEVCGVLIAQKLAISQSSMSELTKVLTRAGFVSNDFARSLICP